MSIADTTLYYTFSTISQTLAGALGLLAALVAWRVSDMEKLIAAAVRMVANQQVDDQYLGLETGQFIAWLAAWIEQQGGGQGRAKAAHANMQRIQKTRDDLLKLTRCSLAATGTAIALAILGLCLTPALMLTQWSAAGALTVGVITAGVSFAYLARLTWRIAAG